MPVERGDGQAAGGLPWKFPQVTGFLGDRTPRYIERSYSEATAEAMDTAVRDILHETFGAALAILTGNRAILDGAAERLMEAEMLDEAALREVAAEVYATRQPRQPRKRQARADPGCAPSCQPSPYRQGDVGQRWPAGLQRTKAVERKGQPAGPKAATEIWCARAHRHLVGNATQ